jgi:hypothetical protein
VLLGKDLMDRMLSRINCCIASWVFVETCSVVTLCKTVSCTTLVLSDLRDADPESAETL